MTLSFDPSRHTDYLQQCLSQDKRPLGLFISAGCPASIAISEGGVNKPLIPTIAGLTTAVVTHIGASANKTLFDIAYGRLTADGITAPDIETILTFIRSLRQVAGKSGVHGLSANDLDALDHSVCEGVVSFTAQLLPNSTTPYHKVAAWISAINRSFPVEIFTTNYDLLMEQALEELRVPYFDGFVGSRQAFFDLHAMEEEALPPRWARLWKLHGSINWGQNGKGQIFRADIADKGQIRVIHPSHLKYDESRRMPYLAMADRLRVFLKRPTSVLVTCGYSFRDDHLNAILAEVLQGHSTSMVFGIIHGSLTDYPKALALAQQLGNLTLLGADGAVVGRKKARWQSSELTASAFPVSESPKSTESVASQSSTSPGDFILGDFVQFGAFLEDLAGLAREITPAIPPTSQTESSNHS